MKAVEAFTREWVDDAHGRPVCGDAGPQPAWRTSWTPFDSPAPGVPVRTVRMTAAGVLRPAEDLFTPAFADERLPCAGCGSRGPVTLEWAHRDGDTRGSVEVRTALIECWACAHVTRGRDAHRAVAGALEMLGEHEKALSLMVLSYVEENADDLFGSP